MKKYIVEFFAEGFEETEAISPLDLLRRAGIPVVTAGVGSTAVRGSHGITVTCDTEASRVSPNEIAGVILPGGMPGTLNLEASPEVIAAVKYAAANNLPVCAICAAPMILGKLGLLRGKRAVCFPGFEKYLEGATVTRARAETDENVVTAVGMGAAVEFGLAIIRLIQGDAAAEKMRQSVIAPPVKNER